MCCGTFINPLSFLLIMSGNEYRAFLNDIRQILVSKVHTTNLDGWEKKQISNIETYLQGKIRESLRIHRDDAIEQ
jgi:hypothetical protein